MKMIMDTLIVNLYGGPGTGKSRLAAGIFSKLKFKGINCELVPEFAKELTWKKDFETLKDQSFVSATQTHWNTRWIGKVDVIVTDSPILLGLAYSGNFYLHELLKHSHAKTNSYDIFLKRVNPYNPKGRSQSEGEAQQLDPVLRNIWERDYTQYSNKDVIKLWDEFDAAAESIEPIVKQILESINE